MSSPLLPIEVEEIQTDWLWDLKHICVHSPSVAAGMTWTEELYTRAQGIHSLLETALHFLKPPPQATYTAAVYLHRFYALHSLQEFPIRDMAITCLFLGCKMADQSKKLTEVVTMFMQREAMLARADTKISESTPEHKELVRRVIYYEDVLLRTLAYDLGADLPFTYAVEAIYRIFGTSEAPRPVWDNGPPPERPLAWYINQSVWNLISMSFYSPICLLMPPNVTAAAGLLLTTRYLGADLPARYRDWYRSMPPYSGDEEPVTEEWFSLLQTDQRYTTWAANLIMETMSMLPDVDNLQDLRRRTRDFKPDLRMPNLFGYLEQANDLSTAVTDTAPVHPSEGDAKSLETEQSDRVPLAQSTEVAETSMETDEKPVQSVERGQALSAALAADKEVTPGASKPGEQPGSATQASPTTMPLEKEQTIPSTDTIAPKLESHELPTSSTAPVVSPVAGISDLLAKEESSSHQPISQGEPVSTSTKEESIDDRSDQPKQEAASPSLPVGTAAAPTPPFPLIAVPSPRRTPLRTGPSSLSSLLNAPTETRPVEEEERLRVEDGEARDEMLRPKAEDEVKQDDGAKDESSAD